MFKQPRTWVVAFQVVVVEASAVSLVVLNLCEQARLEAPLGRRIFGPVRQCLVSELLEKPANLGSLARHPSTALLVSQLAVPSVLFLDPSLL